MFVPQGPTNAVLNALRRGYHLRSSEHENTLLSALPIQYSPLSPSCPVQSQIQVTFHSLIENQSLNHHREKGPYCEQFQPLVFYRHPVY
jgi:hypothetical protein